MLEQLLRSDLLFLIPLFFFITDMYLKKSQSTNEKQISIFTFQPSGHFPSAAFPPQDPAQDEWDERPETTQRARRSEEKRVISQ